MLEFFLVMTLALLLVYWLNYESASFESHSQGFVSLRIAKDTAANICRVSDAVFERNQSIELTMPCFNQSYGFEFKAGEVIVSMHSYPPKQFSLNCTAELLDSGVMDCGKTYLFDLVNEKVRVTEA